MQLFEETGAYLRGHFRLTSGLHSGEYLQCAKVLAHPPYAERLGRELADRLTPLLAGAQVFAVVSPAIGGIVIGHEVARALGSLALFTERDASTNQMTLRRGFDDRQSDGRADSRTRDFNFARTCCDVRRRKTSSVVGTQ